MKLITFQKLNRYYFLFLIYFSVTIIRTQINSSLFGTKLEKSGYFLRMQTHIISHFISFIPYYIGIHLGKKTENKGAKNEAPSEKSSIYYLYNDSQYFGKHVLKYTLLISILDFFSEASVFLFYFANDEPNVTSLHYMNINSIFNTVSLYIVSFFVLKTHFYKHHYLSFGINLICFLLVFINDIMQLVYKEVTNYKFYIYVIVRLIRLVLICFLDCYYKLGIFSTGHSVHSLLAYKGIYETIMLIFFSIPFIFIKMDELYVNDSSIFVAFSEYFSGIKILYSILLIIISYIINLLILLIIDKFSPSHLTLSITFESLGTDIYKLIVNIAEGKETPWYNFVNFGIYIILFIGAMIHNEIFIINRCGFHEKTKLYLNKEFIEENMNDGNMDIEDDDDNKIKKDVNIPLNDINEDNSVML